MSEADYDRIERAFGDSATHDAVAQLNPEERLELRRYWSARADGELTTALSFEFMLDDLEQIGAPGELTSLAERAIGEEHQHVDWCLRWAKLMDPSSPVAANLLGTRPLVFAGASAEDERLLRTVFGGCFSETVAVHVLRASQQLIRVESVRLLNHQHMKEELDHARLGWALLGWSGVTQRDRDMLREHVPELAALTRGAWMSSGRAASETLHAFGYLSAPLVDEACEDALASVVMPGLERLGVL